MTSQVATGSITGGIFRAGVDGGLQYNLAASGVLEYGGTPATYVPLPIISAVVSLDEAWSPYCQAEVVVPTPDAETLDLIDPRDNPRLRLTLTRDWAYPTRPSQSRDFDLLVRERSVDHESGLTTLKLESDEGYLLDRSLVANSTSTAGLGYAESLRSLITWVLSVCAPGSYLQSGSADFDMTANLDALIWEPGTTAWNYLQPLIQASGLRFFCDEQRRWYLVDPSTVLDGQLNISATVNLTRGEDTISRYGDWYDSVVVKYAWTAVDGTRLEAYDSAGAPGTKTFVVNWERPYPGAGAAAAILARAQGRGRVLDLEALPDFNATPGKSIVATLPDTPIQSGVISNVTWRISDDDEGMEIGSRGLADTPANAWILAEGSWSAATGTWAGATGTN